MCKSPLCVAGFIFGFVSLVHLYRIFSHFPIMIGGNVIPDWASIVGFIAFGLLSYWMFASARSSRY